MEENRHVEPICENARGEDFTEAHMVVLEVLGMDCSTCATRVQDALRVLDGVVSADVDWESGLAFVDHVPSKISVDALVRTVADAADDGRHVYRARILS